MKYLFLISWLRAREKKLVDSVDVDRMIAATSVEESFKVLNDTDYAPFIISEGYQTVDNVIYKERENFRKSLYLMDIEKEVVDILFLRDDCVGILKDIKEELFSRKEKQRVGGEKSKDSDIGKEIKERRPQKPSQIDEILDDIYFERMIEFLRREKESSLADFFESYREKLNKVGDDSTSSRDEILLQMEEEILEEENKHADGFLPVLAFFITKRRAEHLVRTIISAKRIGLDKKEINDLINKTRAL